MWGSDQRRPHLHSRRHFHMAYLLHSRAGMAGSRDIAKARNAILHASGSVFCTIADIARLLVLVLVEEQNEHGSFLI